MLKKSVQVPTSYPEGLTFKLAETKDEFEQAFALLQQNYQETGLVDEKQYSLRVTKYHTLPTTHVLIAKMNDEVVGTVSLIEDGAFGLPIDHFASVDDLRKQGRRIVLASTPFALEAPNSTNSLTPHQTAAPSTLMLKTTRALSMSRPTT